MPRSMGKFRFPTCFHLAFRFDAAAASCVLAKSSPITIVHCAKFCFAAKRREPFFILPYSRSRFDCRPVSFRSGYWWAVGSRLRDMACIIRRIKRAPSATTVAGVVNFYKTSDAPSAAAAAAAAGDFFLSLFMGLPKKRQYRFELRKSRGLVYKSACFHH